ncbi:carbohydrate ABC transporter permease [Streptomyces sp. SLBN-31]|jgi:multiple sugar transport system permease protein|uniref:carbohydrate ABC transporter permease n=1 Tax=Streptomyces sp. SLBN-31 TaxID=2768444 RepID=UPI00114F0AA0|nr:sugar ABC transporter permease [Streptomyces sp. SLBN-31]TQJ75664.1 carbohydrate ABC transporter membrane protein 1 (CUT1 family) [Streptomyces sp. SLBN-31]
MSLLRQQGSTATAPPSAVPARGLRTPVAGRRPGGLSARTRHKGMGLLLVSPFLLLFLAFLVAPLCYAFWLSLRTATLVGGDHFSWFANYQQTFTDPKFLAGVRRVVVFGVVQIPLMLGLALLGALIIDEVTSKLAKVFRMTLFMPYAVPAVIGALMWGFLYSPTFGPVNSISNSLGLGKVDLLSHGLMLTSLGNIVTWQWTGYNMIVLYAALQGLPREVYEAAKLDGAGQVQTALRIKIPMISSAMVLALMFTIIGTLQFFTEPRVLEHSASSVITPDYTPNLYAYNLAFQYSEFNYSAAISFSLGAVVFIGSYFFLFATRKRSGLK